MSRHDGTADLALLFSVLEPCVKPILKALQESIQQIDHSRLLYSSYKQCNEYQIWVVDTSSCSGMKVTTTTMTAGTTGPGRNTLSIPILSWRKSEKSDTWILLCYWIRRSSTKVVSWSCFLLQFKRLLVLYHLCCNNSFSKTRKIVNTAS